MRKSIFNIKNFAVVMGCALLSTSTLGLVGCSEEIDESNFAIKSEMTAADFILSNEDYSMAKEIFSKVALGSKDGSQIINVLAARGNYTIFLPNNEAVSEYLKTEGVPSVAELTDEQLNLLAKSCIIDNENSPAYETADFPTTGSFEKANLNDRLLSCMMEDSTSEYIINGTSRVVDENNEVSNGFIHVVNRVVAPSAFTLDRLIGSADNMKVFAYLLKVTGWDKELVDNLDISYEDPDRPKKYELNNVAPFVNQQHRYLGFTAMVEIDSVYEALAGIEKQLDSVGNLVNGEDFIPAIQREAEKHYGTMALTNFTHKDNALNQFVAYHLLKGKMAYNKIVHHFNEWLYKVGDAKNPSRDYPTNVWDYFTTMGPHPRLLKVTQVGNTTMASDIVDKNEHPMFINRISAHQNGPEDDYHEKYAKRTGIRLAATNGKFDNNGLNGYYYPLRNLLVYDSELANEMHNERIRIDVSTVFHELLSNNVRGTEYRHFENGFFENISRESPDTKLLYLMVPGLAEWNDGQGDEFMVAGLYDFTMKLPPVPKDGTYEIRMGVAHNSLRGMCQIYFGSDPDRLKPAGLPYDMRQQAKPENPEIPYQPDGDDWEINYENDRMLRNQGYMKAPQYYTICNGKAETPIRQRYGTWSCVRRIITTANMKANETYYLRFKTALKKTDSQFFMDYIEYASTNVYNNPGKSEDIW